MNTALPVFSIARLPRILFGRGVFQRVANTCLHYGHKVLLVTGAHSFRDSPAWSQLGTDFEKHAIEWDVVMVDGEPSPALVDAAVSKHGASGFDVVLGIGGGSALDAAKAIAGLLHSGHSVMDYLEGVGPERTYEGPSTPFIAVPTTAGTGSEATKNAVLSVQGRDGFKKSFRDEQLVAEYAIVDPALLASCPAGVIAANGMDALTQLMESYVSTGNTPYTDALAISGLRCARDGLLPLYDSEGQDPDAADRMAYASLLSGICLAQTGLGSVHGLASPLGAFYPIPHGVVCGTLVAAATEVNISAMQVRDPENPALERYARLGDVLCEKRHASTEASRRALCERLSNWTEELALQPLSAYGLDSRGIDHVVAHSRGSSMKTNPIVLSDSEIASILRTRL